MRNALAIARRELLSLFVSPVAYFVIAGFVLLSGYFFFNFIGVYNVVLSRFAMMPYRDQMQMPNLNQWVVEGFYNTLLVILVFLVPLLTMRLIAEEKKRGTFELLVTSPLAVRDIVLGKFLGVAAVIVVMTTLIVAYPALLYTFGNPEGLPILSGLLGIILCSLSFASIGMAVSSFSENQIVAGVSSMVVLLLLYVIHAPAESIGGTVGDVLNFLSPTMQVRDMLRGVISVKAIVYFLSLIGLGMFLSERALEAYRWR